MIQAIAPLYQVRKEWLINNMLDYCSETRNKKTVIAIMHEWVRMQTQKQQNRKKFSSSQSTKYLTSSRDIFLGKHLTRQRSIRFQVSLPCKCAHYSNVSACEQKCCLSKTPLNTNKWKKNTETNSKLKTNLDTYLHSNLPFAVPIKISRRAH